MTTTASFAVSTIASVPNQVEAKLCLKTLDGLDNPFTNGGRLERTIGTKTEAFVIQHGATMCTDLSALPAALPSSVTFVLQAPTGSKLLELRLEIVDYASGVDEDRVEIRVTHTGVSAAVAPTLSIDPKDYSWRLSGVKAAMSGDTLVLTFDLVQEEVPTEFVDAQASTRLAFSSNGGGAQQASISVKRSVVLVEPT
jgi:hypothetical protein